LETLHYSLHQADTVPIPSSIEMNNISHFVVCSISCPNLTLRLLSLYSDFSCGTQEVAISCTHSLTCHFNFTLSIYKKSRHLWVTFN